MLDVKLQNRIRSFISYESCGHISGSLCQFTFIRTVNNGKKRQTVEHKNESKLLIIDGERLGNHLNRPGRI